MLLKLFLKIWPAFLPILVYIFWTYIVDGLIVQYFLRKRKIIEDQKIVGEGATYEKKSEEKVGRFSLKNRCFVIILYMSLILAILTLIVTAVTGLG